MEVMEVRKVWRSELLFRNYILYMVRFAVRAVRAVVEIRLSNHDLHVFLSPSSFRLNKVPSNYIEDLQLIDPLIIRGRPTGLFPFGK